MKIVLTRSVFLRCVFPLAQEGVPFLVRIDCEHNHDCGHSYGKKYFHAPRIAHSHGFVLCNEFANTQQKCKHLPARSKREPFRECIWLEYSILQRQ